MLLQQIDEMLAGALTQEDEDAVLAELEAITQVGPRLSFINIYQACVILVSVPVACEWSPSLLTSYTHWHLVWQQASEQGLH